MNDRHQHRNVVSKFLRISHCRKCLCKFQHILNSLLWPHHIRMRSGPDQLHQCNHNYRHLSSNFRTFAIGPNTFSCGSEWVYLPRGVWQAFYWNRVWCTVFDVRDRSHRTAKRFHACCWVSSSSHWRVASCVQGGTLPTQSILLFEVQSLLPWVSVMVKLP